MGTDRAGPQAHLHLPTHQVLALFLESAFLLLGSLLFSCKGTQYQEDGEDSEEDSEGDPACLGLTCSLGAPCVPPYACSQGE